MILSCLQGLKTNYLLKYHHQLNHVVYVKYDSFLSCLKL